MIEPGDGKAYERDPRSLAKRAEAYLKSSGLGDTAFFGPEPEFFIFDSVRWSIDMSGCFVKIDSEEAAWNTGKEYEGGNTGHRPTVKGGYFPVPPVDIVPGHALGDVPDPRIARHPGRSAPPRSGQRRPDARSAPSSRTLVAARRLDCRCMKYVIQNVAHALRQDRDLHAQADRRRQRLAACTCTSRSGRTARTCSPATATPACREFALYYIGGIIKHARALNAITNPGTNSYKRLVPGFEAPVKLAYSARNRSASIRIPYVANPKGRRIEVRFPDPTGEPVPRASPRC